MRVASSEDDVRVSCVTMKRGTVVVDSSGGERLTCLSCSARGVLLHVQVQPRASKNEVAGVLEGSLKLRLTAPPVEGEANKECVKFLAKLFNIPKSSVEIIQGQKSRRKTVLIKGPSLEQVENTLRQSLRC